MKILAAPVIHARTEHVDFRAGLLVKPVDFDDRKTKWARKYILSSTRYFEMSGMNGRWLVFCDQETVVVGVSILITQLYRHCQTSGKYDKVQGNRSNYAFIGVAMPKTQLDKIPLITWPMFLEIYEKYMDLRWEETYSIDALKATEAEYEYFEVEETAQICEADFGDFQSRKICSMSVGSEQSIIARMLLEMKNRNEISFCSDMPNKRSIQDSDFLVVTTAFAERIQGEINSENQTEKEEIQTVSTKTKDSNSGTKIIAGIIIFILVVMLLLWLLT